MPNTIPRGLKRKLTRIVGSTSVIDDPAGINVYSYDSSLQAGRPEMVVFPETTEHVAAIMRLLYSENIPHLGRGAGTNLSGGSIAARGGVTIALSGMRRILEISPAGQFARVQPGVTNLALQEALKQFGFFFAPDPASQRVSTIGGNLAENSGGPHCLKYGVTANHILGATVVAPGGEILELGGQRLFSPGLDLLGLFVGSEGTFGIATEVICRILPLPRAVRTMLAVYDSTEDAGRTVSDIIAAGIVPATLEMMDNLVIRAVEESHDAGYPTDADAVLIIEVDGIEEALADLVTRIEAVCRRNRVRDIRIAADDNERDVLWTGRRGAFGAVARLFPNYSVSDGAVPRTKLPQVLRLVTEVGKRYGLSIGNVFHAGDGNLHPLIFFDARNAEQLERVHRASEDILRICAEAGGAISGEHGIGAEKISAMPLVFGPLEMELMRRIKRAIDPADLCNPGKILPRPDSAPVNDMTASAKRLPAAGHLLDVPLYSPEDLHEVSGLIRHLHDEKHSFAAIGADTLFSRLPYQRLPEALVSTRLLNTIIEYDADNLTIAAGAGLTLGELQDHLVKKNQFLPLDAPPQATLGGIVAAGIPGLRRCLYGAPRDLVLGLKFLDSSGRILKAGGKTVKNVAGYDYGKLLIGSWGTLGLIAEITFRLLPLPETTAGACAGFARFADACEAGAGILAAGINPSLLMLLNQKASLGLAAAGHALPPQPYVLIYGAEGFEPAVRRQMAEMKSICSRTSTCILETFVESKYAEVLAAASNLGYPFSHPNAFLTLCLSYPLDDVQKVLTAVQHLENCAVSSYAAHLAAGILFVHLLSVNGPDEARICTRLREQFPRMSIIVLAQKSGIEDGKKSLIKNDSISGTWPNLIKKSLDPHNLLNPGLMAW